MSEHSNPAQEPARPKAPNGAYDEAKDQTVPPGPDTKAGETGEQPEPRLGSDAHRDTLYKSIRAELAGASLHDEEIQYELARWVEMLETVKEDIKGGAASAGEESRAGLVRRLLRKAGAAIPALISDKPELVFARTLRMRAEMQLWRHNGWLTRKLVAWTDGSPVMLVGLGAGAAMLPGVLLHLVWLALSAKGVATGSSAMVVLSGAFLGGLLSVLSRFQSFSQLRDFDPMFLFLNALAKPFIGAIFGLFAYAAVAGKMLPLDEAALLAGDWSVWAIGFLAGFSERFMNDLVSRGEGLAAPRKT